MIKTVLVLLLVYATLSGFAYSQDLNYTGELPPIDIGSSCYVQDQTYVWQILERNRWTVADLVAAPSGIQNPSEWNSTDGFRERLSEAAGSNPDISALADACVAIWHDFISNEAELFVLFVRTTTITVKEIRCLNGNWAISEESSSVETAESDWIKVNAATYDIDMTPAETILNETDERLLEINSQPGADIRPYHSYSSN